MKYFEHRHVFNHDWETCTSAWWAKYPNPDQPHVKRLDTVYRNIDKDNQVLQVRRIFALDYQIPDIVQKLLPKMQGYAMEDTTVDLKKKKLTAVGQNCTFSKICRSREVITYEEDPNDPSKTIYTQRMSYSISGFGMTVGRRLEKAATDFSAKKAQAGEAVMSKHIDRLAATDWRNDTSTWKKNIVGMLNLEIARGRLTAVQASDQLRGAVARLAQPVVEETSAAGIDNTRVRHENLSNKSEHRSTEVNIPDCPDFTGAI
ncbi:hypothetical protein, conserved [Perkinsus marinus ATCC 50983]|uniref:PRELI/MSF1 domain-containing protein n=1 Tax=Perkinsus marinus (strain ATCC 50983 / TXsc) TaxID=423536 RepID=C5LLZ8_PERM5|nr:hypothetical protein, conserved [Perkinsus marinus ATCC 50983]EER02244.1 hypothetical protein, conserved [Perkinsus marinus ATCC 50983]|eukprot:XP_002769526.1 hypothetical protein, conserved [Perkinsus marinus ATCC 50983]